MAEEGISNDSNTSINKVIFNTSNESKPTEFCKKVPSFKETKDRLLQIVHPKRTKEITRSLVRQINQLTGDELTSAIASLKEPKRFIRGGKGRQLTVPILLATLDNNLQIQSQGLIDSGCTGSCINESLVKKYQLVTKKTPLAIPVYNADGTLNKAGAIKEYISMRLSIHNHVERIDLAVTNLGDTDIFIGHEWLKKHNPSIDWVRATINFDRCPEECNMPNSSQSTPENINSPLKTCQLVKENIIVPDFSQEYPTVFSEQEFNKLPERRSWDHAIETKPDFVPKDCKIYPLTVKEQEALDQFLDENLKSGRIRPSKSPQASPFFFIKKKDGTLRPIQDYRKLNEGTIKNRYPIPLIQELLDKTKMSNYFTKLDVRWGYNNIRIKEGDEWKAAFKTNRGLFEPTVMFFGLTNSPATFQAFMNTILKDLIQEGSVIVYLDDILIFTRCLSEHIRLVRQVLQVLKDNHLCLRYSKCSFAEPKIGYLGYVVGGGKIEMETQKIKAIQEWPEPKNVKQLESFLGFCGFYRRFVKGYSHITTPLNRLKGKSGWKWGKEEAEAVIQLKQAITSAPVLAVPTDNDPFRIETDASNFAIGAVLSQKQDNKWHPIAFMSESMTSEERNYPIYDKEMLAIIKALKEWRPYLYEAKHTVEVWTDHANIQYFREPQDLNRRQARWMLLLWKYDLTIIHKPGKEMKKANLLSRRVDHNRGENDNRRVTMLKSEWFRATSIESLDTELIKNIKESTYAIDQSVKRALDNKEKDWAENDHLITWQNKIYVPKDKTLRAKIIKVHHDETVAGHPGRNKTQELITRNFWWPRMTNDIRLYVSGCDTCQRTKAHRNKKHAPLNPNEIPTRPWEIISIDLIGELPESKGFNAICVIVDRFSKQIHALPTNMELTSEGLARIYRDQVFRLHGIPRKIISDRGPQFESNFMHDLYRLLGITGNPSTAYHPQTDGQTERINQEIEQYLRAYINHRQSDWAEWLAIAEFSYNDKVQSSTGYSPFFVNYGLHPYKGSNPRKEPVNESAGQFAKTMQKVREEVEASLKKAAEVMKHFYDRNKGESIEYKKGDLVMLEATNLPSMRPMKKLDCKRYGPFEIIEKVNKGAYKLKLPNTWRRIHPVFNEVLLSPYTTPVFENQQQAPPPPPVLIGKEQEYEVESIIDSKFVRNKLKFLVHWKGYGVESRTWEPEEHLENSKELIEEFYKENPRAPRRLRVIDVKYIPSFKSQNHD